MADFPAAVTTLTDPTSTDKLNSPSHSSQHSNLNDEVEAIETELGINPAGAYATVVARQDAELGSQFIPIVAAAGSAITMYFTAPYACTFSGFLNTHVSTGTGRSVSIAHGSAGDDIMAVAAFVTNGTVGVSVAFTASATATVTANEVVKVSCTSCATAQVYGVTIVMTNPT